MNRKALAEMMVARFMAYWQKLVKQHQQFQNQFNRKLDELRDIFGREVVDQQFATDFGGTTPKSKKPDKKQCGESKRRKGLTYSQLRPHVIEAINSLYTGPGGPDICTKEIEAKLLEKKLLFKRSHMTLIILRDLEGLVKSGNTIKDGKRRPMNIYRISGTVGLRPAKRFRKVG